MNIEYWKYYYFLEMLNRLILDLGIFSLSIGWKIIWKKYVPTFKKNLAKKIKTMTDLDKIAEQTARLVMGKYEPK